MTKKHFIALTDSIREQNAHGCSDASQTGWTAYTPDQIESLADFCASQNPQFDRSRWLGYIAGAIGQNGGKRG